MNVKYLNESQFEWFKTNQKAFSTETRVSSSYQCHSLSTLSALQHMRMTRNFCLELLLSSSDMNFSLQKLLHCAIGKKVFDKIEENFSLKYVTQLFGKVSADVSL